MTKWIPFPLRYAIARWRLHWVTRPIDRQIAEARRRHKPVKHLMAAKASLIEAGLRG